jgi:chromosome segregation ATPase
MDLDEIVKRLEKLDSELRAGKTQQATLENRIVQLESTNNELSSELKKITSELTRLKTMQSKFIQVDKELAQIRVDFRRDIEGGEKLRLDREEDQKKSHQAEMAQITKTVGELKKDHDAVLDLRKAIKLRTEEDLRLEKMINKVSDEVHNALYQDEDYRRAQKIIEDTMRQDGKKLADLGVEAANLRKRVDESKARLDLNSDSITKIDNRLNEFQSLENERRQMQSALMEKQALIQVERDRIWKDWQVRFDQVQKNNETFEVQIQDVEAAKRSLKRSQESFDEIMQKIERRINEVTEMQRLGEERFRTEWVTFRAEDQKRWTNYSLTQEEVQREINEELRQTEERLVHLEDVSQEISDTLKQTFEDYYQRMGSLHAVIRDWLDLMDKSRSLLR